MKDKALIAMSGGVDSSVCAFLTQRMGYECVGATMHLFDSGDDEKTCGSSKDAEDAADISKSLGMKHYVYDYSDEFKKNVINRFINEYKRGGTPNPCIDCNRYMKFNRLLKQADELGCSHIATGHYAIVEYNDSTKRYELKKAKDSTKDQSYVLYSLTQEQLSRVIFPLGELTKNEVRKIAEENGFVNSKKKDSQDICFVPNGDYAEFIEHYTGKKFPCGKFIDKDGKILGKHSGIIRYTIGQRKGLGIALGKPAFVCDKCAENNTVTLGDNEDLFSTELDVFGFNWISKSGIDKPFKAMAKIRYNQDAQPATITQTAPDTVHVVFDEPQRAIAKGQAAVIYDDDTVVGGGTIK